VAGFKAKRTNSVLPEWKGKYFGKHGRTGDLAQIGDLPQGIIRFTCGSVKTPAWTPAERVGQTEKNLVAIPSKSCPFHWAPCTLCLKLAVLAVSLDPLVYFCLGLRGELHCLGEMAALVRCCFFHLFFGLPQSAGAQQPYEARVRHFAERLYQLH
jgi:hypothetical protein